VQIGFFGYFWLPEDLTVYMSATYGDGRAGCIRSRSGDLNIFWSAGRIGRIRVAPKFLWVFPRPRPADHDEQLMHFELFQSGASQFVEINHGSAGLRLGGAVRSQLEIDLLLQVARSFQRRRDCTECRPAEIAQPLRQESPDSDSTSEGCSEPMQRGPATIGQANTQSFDEKAWVREFDLDSRAAQTFTVNDRWVVQPVCVDNILSRVVIGRGLGRLETPFESLSTGEFERALRQLNRVQPLGIETFEFNYPPIGHVATDRPVHAQMAHAMVEGEASVGSKIGIEIRPLNVWYYRPISGVVEELRGPIGTDLRAVVRLGGQWYWTDEASFVSLRVGEKVTNLVAAGPDGAPRASDVATCRRVAEPGES